MTSSLKGLLDRIGPFIAVALVAAMAANGTYLLMHLMKVWGAPLESVELPQGGLRGNDFVAFWAAAKLAVSGELSGLYSPERFALLQSELVGIGEHEKLPWLYPPFALPLFAPLGLLPYNAALVVWQVGPLLLLLALLYRLGLPLPAFLAVALSGPALSSITTGQNGILMAALLLLALMSFARRPFLAGLLLGLIAIKPQWAAGLGLTLLLAGQWRALSGMVCSVGALALAAFFLYGLEPWFGFFEALQLVQGYLTDVGQRLKWYRLTSLYTGLATLGVPATAALVAQVASAIGAALAVAILWRSGANEKLRLAALAAMVPLVPPYFYDYDMMVLLVAYAFLLSDRLGPPLARHEMLLLLPAWLLGSMWVKYLLLEIGFAAGFLAVFPVLAILFMRSRQARSSRLAEIAARPQAMGRAAFLR